MQKDATAKSDASLAKVACVGRKVPTGIFLVTETSASLGRMEAKAIHM
jgi:hypothetical protein